AVARGDLARARGAIVLEHRDVHAVEPGAEVGEHGREILEAVFGVDAYRNDDVDVGEWELHFSAVATLRPWRRSSTWRTRSRRRRPSLSSAPASRTSARLARSRSSSGSMCSNSATRLRVRRNRLSARDRLCSWSRYQSSGSGTTSRS